MFLRSKINFVPTLIVLLGFVFAAPLAAGQAPPGGNASTANATTPTIDKAAIEEQAAKNAAAKQAEKDAAESAAKRAAIKAEFEANPLTVICIEPYVDPEYKGTCDASDAKKSIPGKAGMGDRIKINIPRLSRAAENGVVDSTRLVLFIDGRVFPGVYPESVGYDSLIYKLERSKDAIDAWNGLLGSPGLDPSKPVIVSVGNADQKPLELAKGFPQKTNLNLIVYRKRWAVGSLLVLVIVVVVFLKYGKNMLRDSGPPTPKNAKNEDAQRPYSLAKVQVAWWFFLVVGCFLLIYLITGEYTMTEQALILIGIGTGTALGSAMIDNSKRSSSDSDLMKLYPQREKLKAEISSLTDPVALAEKNEELKGVEQQITDSEQGLTKPFSEGFWNDLVTDSNGPSFHRFQMSGWTVILGILFLAGVYKNLSMPEFSGTMLALMGISAGTYLGFKIPEKQNQGDSTVTNSAPPAPPKAKPVEPPPAAPGQGQPAAPAPTPPEGGQGNP